VATVCVHATSCVDSNYSGLAVCDSTGNCQPQPGGACTYSCTQDGCTDRCAADSECIYSYCDATSQTCKPQRYAGTPCSANDQCLSNSCNTTCQ
jgi:hypothetical protein